MTIKMPRNLMTAISVVAFAVLLHGCGGGGGSSPTTTGRRNHYGRHHHHSDDDHGPDRSGRNYDHSCRQTMDFLDITVRAVMGQTIALREMTVGILRVPAPCLLGRSGG